MTGRWVAALAIMLLAALSACAPKPTVRQQDDAIRFAVDAAPFPPFAMQDASGQWTGFEIDLMNAVCTQMKAKCTVVPTPWDALIANLQSGEIDVIWSSMTVTDARKDVIDFSNVYYNTPMILVAAKSSIIDPSRPETLKGKRIAALEYQTAFAEKTFGQTGEIVPIDSLNDEGLDDVMNKTRADAILIDQFLADTFLKSSRGSAFAVKWTAPWNLAATAGVAAGLRKTDTDLKARLNAALKAVRESGQHKEIQRRYFDFDISGM